MAEMGHSEAMYHVTYKLSKKIVSVTIQNDASSWTEVHRCVQEAFGVDQPFELQLYEAESWIQDWVNAKSNMPPPVRGKLKMIPLDPEPPTLLNFNLRNTSSDDDGNILLDIATPSTSSMNDISNTNQCLDRGDDVENKPSVLKVPEMTNPGKREADTLMNDDQNNSVVEILGITNPKKISNTNQCLDRGDDVDSKPSVLKAPEMTKPGKSEADTDM